MAMRCRSPPDKLTACAACKGVKALVKLHDEVVAAAFLRHDHDLLIRGSRVAMADVLHDGFVEQIVVLRHIGHFSVKILREKMTNVHTADLNGTAADIPEGGNQLGNGGFAAAGRPYNGVDRACLHGHGHPVKHLLFMIGEAHILQGDAVIAWRFGAFLRPL